MLTSEIQTVQIYMTKTKAIFLSPLIWHTDHLPPELSPHIQGGKPCKSVSKEQGLETIPHGNCLLRMCKYEYACHINRITPKWSTNSFIIKTAHCRPVAYRTSTQMWCFFNSLYLFALSMCGQFLSKVVFLCSSAYEVPYFTTHGIVDSCRIEELKCFAIFTRIHLYISEETYDNHKWFLAWPQHNQQPVVRLPVAQRTRLSSLSWCHQSRSDCELQHYLSFRSFMMLFTSKCVYTQSNASNICSNSDVSPLQCLLCI